MKNISILGSTGSIGTNALRLVAKHPDKFKVVGLAEGHDVNLLAQQIEQFKPSLVSVRDAKAAGVLKTLIKNHVPEIVYGLKGAALVAAMPETEIVLSAIVGAAGLVPTVEAIKKGKTIALANKETLVAGGAFVTSLARQTGSKILPVDSEHSAIFQSLVGHRAQDVSRIILTASGGPFRRHSLQDLEKVTKQDALKHPRWEMGAKITIDSATLMNKGLEVIEAHWLFNVPAEKIAVVIHPESIVHSMVEYIDGCVMAELGMPDMQAPIAYALAYPERIQTNVEPLDLTKISTLQFEKPDLEKFPALSLAYQALKQGGSYSIVLNAANEVAVQAFLEEKIRFKNIAQVVEKTMAAHSSRTCMSVEDILDVDTWARKEALKGV